MISSTPLKPNLKLHLVIAGQPVHLGHPIHQEYSPITNIKDNDLTNGPLQCLLKKEGVTFGRRS